MFLRVANMIVFPLTILSGILLSAAGLSPFVHPSYSSWLPLLGLTFPFLFIINIVLLIYWWVQLKFKLIIPLCFIILNLIHISKYIQYTSERKVSDSSIHVASYNTQLFGNYQDTNYFGHVLNHLRKEKYDILCMQEFYAKINLSERVLSIKREGKFRFHHFQRLSPDRPYGMVIYTNYPVIRSGRVGLGEKTGNMAIWSDLLVQNDTVRVYNLHLQSIRFGKKDYAFINNAGGEASKIEGSKNLIRRMREAYLKRAVQADSLAIHMAECKYKKIVMGDFNDVPLSYTYNKLMTGMLDVFRESGNGFEKTYKGPFPNFRIDYILISKGMGCANYKSFGDVPGDHKLITARVSLKQP